MVQNNMIAVDKRSSIDSSEILPKDYSPSENTVLSGKGKKSFNHRGNVEFRSIVKAMLPGYQMLKTKQEKTYVLSYIVEKVKGTCPDGIGFVRSDKSGRWYELSDEAAREKVGFTLRQTARIPQSRQRDCVVSKEVMFTAWLSKSKLSPLLEQTTPTANDNDAAPDVVVSVPLDVESVFPRDRSDLAGCTPDFVASEGPALSEDTTLEELLANESDKFTDPFFKDVRPEESILKSAWLTLSL